ncbi:MAG: hypothetical protein BV459_01955 [Thermoplasmata archaeon M11B2D]|nr:MAG: hypothetical protein BV459_01955 [Thermoplasmata archaeon M11B2D]
MLGNLFLKSIDRIMNPEGGKIYLRLEGEIERDTGGKYITNPPLFYEKVPGATVVRSGHFNLKNEINGIKYKGVEEYHIPMDEIDRLGITERDMPRIMIIHGNAVFRVMNWQYTWGMRTVRCWVEKTKDEFPNTYSAWTFEHDTVGETPTGWDVDDPTPEVDPIEIQEDDHGNTGKFVVITNKPIIGGTNPPHPYISLPVTNYLPGPAVKVRYRALITGVVDTSGLIGWDLGADVKRLSEVTIAAYVGVFSLQVDGVHYRDILGGTLFDVNIEQDEWYTYEVTMDKFGNNLKLKITRESTSEITEYEWTYDELFGENLPPPVLYITMSGVDTLGFLGKVATRVIDDVEVWSIVG